MRTVELGEVVGLSEIIRYALTLDTRSDEVRDEFPCLYTHGDPDQITEDIPCLVEDYPKVFDDRDMYPEAVRAGGFEILYYGQQFVDVIENARRQLSSDDMASYVSALNYYLDRDDFLDF